MEVFIPLLMAAIVDGGLYGSPDFTLRKYFSAELIADKTRFVIILGGIMVLAAMLSLAFGMLAARTAAVASMGFAKNLRRKVFEKILSFSFKNTDRFSTPSLVMRTTADINNVQNLYQQMIRIFVRAPVMMVLAAVMALRVNAELSVIFLVALPIMFCTLISMGMIGKPRFRIMLKKYDKMNASVQENLVAARVVKSFAREDYEKRNLPLPPMTLKGSNLRTEAFLPPACDSNGYYVDLRRHSDADGRQSGVCGNAYEGRACQHVDLHQSGCRFRFNGCNDHHDAHHDARIRDAHQRGA